MTSGGVSPDPKVEFIGEWAVEEGVRCVVCPDCAFTFDAGHTDVDGGGYSCPLCDPDACVPKGCYR